MKTQYPPRLFFFFNHHWVLFLLCWVTFFLLSYFFFSFSLFFYLYLCPIYWRCYHRCWHRAVVSPALTLLQRTEVKKKKEWKKKQFCSAALFFFSCWIRQAKKGLRLSAIYICTNRIASLQAAVLLFQPGAYVLAMVHSCLGHNVILSGKVSLHLFRCPHHSSSSCHISLSLTLSFFFCCRLKDMITSFSWTFLLFVRCIKRYQ